jgi:predicted O-methyltransferase YrrM
MPLRLKVALSYRRPTVGRILRWGFQSREYTSFTYEYTEHNRAYLAHLLHVITGCPVDRVRTYLAEPAEDLALQRSLSQRRADGPYAGVLDEPVRLGRQRVWYALARALKPGRIIETGVGFGLSAAVLASAMRRNALDGAPGRYIGVDVDPAAGSLLSPADREWAEVIQGESVPVLERLDWPIDFFISDSHVSPELELAECVAVQPRLSRGAVIATTISTTLPDFAEATGRECLVFREEPKDHWFPGNWLGFAYPARDA